MRYGAIVPLIGGELIAHQKVTGVDPEFILSYTPFEENEKNIRNYMPNVPYYQLDNTEGPQFNPALHQDVDFISALCPCAGLSQLSSGSAEVRESRNEWMIKSAEYILGTVKPKVFWGENAPTFFTSRGEGVRNKLNEIAIKNGYSFSCYHTNSLLHGIPQSRKRSFYFFWRDSNPPVFEFFDTPHPTLAEYLKDVPAGITHHTAEDLADARKRLVESDKLINFLLNKYGDGYLQVMREDLATRGKNNLSILAYVIDAGLIPEAIQFFLDNKLEREHRWLTNLAAKLAAGRGIWDGTLQIVQPAGHFMTLIFRTMFALHPTEDRCITLRECMHLMGLPHDFNLVTTEWNHVCQNVPVKTASDMTREVIAALAGDREIATSRYIMQSNLKRDVQYVDPKTRSDLLEFE